MCQWIHPHRFTGRTAAVQTGRPCSTRVLPVHSSTLRPNLRFSAFHTQPPGNSPAFWGDPTPPGTSVRRHPSSTRHGLLLRYTCRHGSYTRRHGSCCFVRSKLTVGHPCWEPMLGSVCIGQPDSIQLFCRGVQLQNFKLQHLPTLGERHSPGSSSSSSHSSHRRARNRLPFVWGVAHPVAQCDPSENSQFEK